MLLSFVLLGLRDFLLQLVVKEGNNRLDFVPEKDVLFFVTQELNSDDLAKLSHEGSLAVDCLKTAKFFHFRGQFVPEFDLGDSLNLIVDFAG